jgi:beta-xylosidase
MHPNGLNFTGDAAVELISNTLPWEGSLVEGPWHIFRAPYHYIFYSANGYASDRYAVGVARSKSPLGPYTKKGEPILRSNEKWIGPGHCSVISKHGKNEEFVMVYHSWIKDHVGDDNIGRKMLMDVVKWSSDGWPEIQGGTPSIKPQPKP